MTRLIHAWRVSRRAGRITCCRTTLQLRHLTARIDRLEGQP